MGRATSGVIGMRFREDDELLSMDVVRPETFLFTATSGGYGKRTPVDMFPLRGRGGLGVIAARTVDERGGLVGATVVNEGDEVMAITLGGGVIRTRVAEVRPTSRDTMGVRVINLGKGDSVLAIARNADPGEPEDLEGGEHGDHAEHGDHPDGHADAAGTAEANDESRDSVPNGGSGETDSDSNGSLAE
jgi:DNA gyrase subunit A